MESMGGYHWNEWANKTEYALRKAGPQEKAHKLAIGSGKFKTVVMQIVLLDMLFSIDSVMTAVGVTRDYWIMATAVIISILLMVALPRY